MCTITNILSTTGTITLMANVISTVIVMATTTLSYCITTELMKATTTINITTTTATTNRS